MDSPTKPDPIRRFETACRQRGIPVTVQRRRILEAILVRTDHPTPDQVYASVKKVLPDVSRTTVYRVLEAFVRVGVARKVCHRGAAARYEIVLDRLPLPGSKADGFEATDYSIQFRGICANCAKAAGASERPISPTPAPIPSAPASRRQAK